MSIVIVIFKNVAKLTSFRQSKPVLRNKIWFRRFVILNLVDSQKNSKFAC